MFLERPLKSQSSSAKEGASEAERALRRWALEGERVELNRGNATIKHRLVGRVSRGLELVMI